MDVQRDDPLTQIRIHARLYGRRHAGRVAGAVLQALRPHVPASDFGDLAAQLPAEVVLAGDPVVTGEGCEAFVRDIAERLGVATPDAAFYARVTFGWLNAYCHGVTPAAIAPSAPACLRPLLTARAQDPSLRVRRLLQTLGAAAGSLTLRVPAAEPRTLDPVFLPAPSARAVKQVGNRA